MPNPEISVVIPVYNVERYLPECIGSLKAQTFGDFEAICVDDGSTDSSLEILLRTAGEDPRFIVVKKENTGSALSRKAGLSKVHGRYVYFLDSDDALEPNALERLHENITSNGTEMVYLKYCEYDGVHKTPYPDSDYSPCFPSVRDFSSFTFSGRDSGDALLNKTGSMWCSMVSSGLFARHDDWFFPEKSVTLIEDLPLHCQLHLRASSISFCNEFLYLYRNSREGSTLSLLRNSEKSMGIFRTMDEVERIMRDEVVFDSFFHEFALFKISHVKVIYDSLSGEIRERYFARMREEFGRLGLTRRALRKVRYDNFVFFLAVLESETAEELEKKRKGLKFYLMKSFYKIFG